MEKIEFKDLPDTTTPIVADNLNLLQDNVENAIGEIIDSGSNENGNWIKYPDGTMICWNSKTEDNISLTSTYGSLYTNAKSYDFPQSFISTPAGICSQFKFGTGASWGTINSISTTQISCRALDVVSRESGTTVQISWMAIGKWK